MKNYKVTVNGTTYDVEVEEIGGEVAVKSVAPAPKPVAAPKPAPAAAPAPAPKPAAAKPAPAAGGGEDVVAPLNGSVLSVAVKEGDVVKAGQLLLVFEAMKMENEIFSPRDGTVKKIHVSVGAAIETGAPVVTLA